QDLRQRDVDHRAAGKGQPERQQTWVRAFGEQHQQAADGGGQAGSKGQGERQPEIVTGDSVHARGPVPAQPPRRARSSMAKHSLGLGSGGLKLTGTWMVVGTGWPLRVAGLNFHSRTRRAAESSNWLLPLLVTSDTSVGVPCGPTTTRSTL